MKKLKKAQQALTKIICRYVDDMIVETVYDKPRAALVVKNTDNLMGYIGYDIIEENINEKDLKYIYQPGNDDVWEDAKVIVQLAKVFGDIMVSATDTTVMYVFIALSDWGPDLEEWKKNEKADLFSDED